MTVYRDKFLLNETNRRTEFHFYCYYDFTCFGQPFCPSSDVLSPTSALVHFMQIWWPFATRSRMELDVFRVSSNAVCSAHWLFIFDTRE